MRSRVVLASVVILLATVGPDSAVETALAQATSKQPRCPGGVTSAGDCCVRGIARGASCIPSTATCHQSTTLPVPRLVRTTAEIPEGQPSSGYRVHLIDVGTGLAILIQGAAFTMLYDGGSGDDERGISGSGNHSRLLAYLWHAIGPSGPADCTPLSLRGVPRVDRAELPIHHLVLSHPHEDHGVYLDEVLHCYDVDVVWDSGAINDRAFYRNFIEAVTRESGVEYRTATDVGDTLQISSRAFDMSGARRSRFTEGQEERLDANASFRVLHADGGRHHDANANSIVLRIDLGATSLLLTGDAESGPREPPDSPLGDIEEHLVTNYADAIDVDILQVGHHGSMTSNRLAFLDAVSPNMALIGCGPRRYRGVRLPDPEVVDELVRVLGSTGRLLRTDPSDAGCPAADRVGADDRRPGGCDNWVVEL